MERMNFVKKWLQTKMYFRLVKYILIIYASTDISWISIVRDNSKLIIIKKY